MGIKPRDIKEVLCQVKMPGSQENIVALDMLQGIRIEGKKVSFTLVFQRSNEPNVAIVKAQCIQVILRNLGKDLEVAGNISIR